MNDFILKVFSKRNLDASAVKGNVLQSFTAMFLLVG